MDLSEILKKTEQRSAKLPRPKPHLVSGDGPRPYDEDVKRYQESLLKHDGNDSGTTREPSTPIGGTAREQAEVVWGTNEPISGTTREQSIAISGTTRERLGNKQRLPREQIAT